MTGLECVDNTEVIAEKLPQFHFHLHKFHVVPWD